MKLEGNHTVNQKAKNDNQTAALMKTEYHPLFNVILKEFQTTLKSIGNVRAIKAEQKVTYKSGEYYVVCCFRSLTALMDRERQIKEAIRFIEKRPPESYLRGHKMSHQDFFDYHYNALLAYYTSFPECIYQTINTVLNLGLDEKNVGYALLEKHKWISDVKLKGEIKELEKLRAKHTFDRNQAIHQGRPKRTTELRDYFSFDFLSNIDIPDKNLKEVLAVHRKTRRKVFKGKVGDILSPVKSDFESVLSENEKIMGKLIPYFEFWTNAGKNTASLPCMVFLD